MLNNMLQLLVLKICYRKFVLNYVTNTRKGPILTKKLLILFHRNSRFRILFCEKTLQQNIIKNLSKQLSCNNRRNICYTLCFG